MAVPSPLLTLVGRSSSHFTRVARIFAAELCVPYKFEPVYDLMSTNSDLFAGNPLLTVPSLQNSEGTWFGALSCSRAFAREASSFRRIVWPEDATTALSANAQEIVLSAMSAEVVVIMGRNNQLEATHPALHKPLERVAAAVSWLESNLAAALAALPTAELSYLEVTAFCLLEHLDSRGFARRDEQPRLREFCAEFAKRDCARQTPYHFDVAPAR